MIKRDDKFSKELLATFAIEADEHLKAISENMLKLEKTIDDDERQAFVETTFREIHSLKGASRAVNLRDIEAVCRPLESVFAKLKSNELSLSPELSNLIFETVNTFEQLLALIGEEITAEHEALLDSLNQRLEKASFGISEKQAKPALQTVTVTPEPKAVTSGTVRVSTAKLDTLFRQVEEMIGAKLAAEQRVSEMSKLIDRLGSNKKKPEKYRTRLLSITTALEETRSNTSEINIEIAKWLDDLGEDDTVRREMAESMNNLINAARTDHRELSKMVDNLLEEIKKLLMMPLSSLFELFPKIVRDLAQDQGKEIEFVIKGDAIEIDRRIQEQLKDPLIHLIRNCVDHGIENPQERKLNNKPASGKISISVSQIDTGKAEIVIADDGAGIDTEKVLSVAKKSGVINTEDSARLDEQKIRELVFRSGVSTSSIITDISGRGLGMAIVREKIENLNGAISLESKTGAGTTFHINLPVTLSSFRGVVVRVIDQDFVLPIINVEQVVRVKKENIKTIENRETIKLNGNSISLVRMADVLGLHIKPVTAKQNDYEQIVILTSGNEHIAYIVDRIVQEQEILVKDLGKQLVHVRNISGSTTLGTGELVPLLNIPDLMKSSINVVFSHDIVVNEQTGNSQRVKSILIADDSITARSLVKNILEAAGYKVTTAVDGLDALTTLKTGEFDLLVSDVEMPRMDGFDLTTEIRAEKKYKELPIILVTALASREHRERGINAGANAYIVKSNFDESGLLEIIDRLI